MPNYREAETVGWQRAREVHVVNEFNQIPVITFVEEVLVQTPGMSFAQPAGELQENMSDPNKTFDLRNPETGEVIGAATYQQIYVMLHSLYYHLALARDAAQIP